MSRCGWAVLHYVRHLLLGSLISFKDTQFERRGWPQCNSVHIDAGDVLVGIYMLCPVCVSEMRVYVCITY